jgi:tRNA-specific 2-thiouridylase
MKILCAISGGVDSAVAAHMLKERGHEVAGAFFRQPSSDNTRSAKEVAAALGIDLQVLDFKAEFEKIISYFVAEYGSGRTPNPCVVCNREIKFGALLEHARGLGFDAIATGHYARIVEQDGRRIIARPADRGKDQTYFLFPLSQEQLAGTVFPNGDITKDEVRELAAALGLTAAGKPESQDVCFTAGALPGDFIRSRFPEKVSEGPILDTKGNVVGTHRGIQYYTIGQRRGLGAFGGPRYVVSVDAGRNAVTIGERDDLLAARVTASGAVWSIDEKRADFPLRGEGQVRYNMRAQPCTFRPLENGRMEAIFDEPVRGVTPGQALVIYHDGLLAAGGWIERS